ncbi:MULTISPECIES: LysR family transcriptional regulator [Streptomyces]|uniref:LysR substrate-binding domain-containing protein n=1 Tax=Streptomyces rubrogriseus TaxID=194673 RepID=A0ABT4P896_9ACTN|nr:MULTISPECIES: LysR substrate-binding domain-containing protein [Streptomyces]MCW8116689.1 LysR substrate-binding domain-containing protein [Streptomyces anthocyanicus]MCZ4637366.1 LysR substrate-binding domain-containing protein [Streptomyces rubrogriseus]REH21787.1 transcriptional regulator [Streptomyces sp. 2221.1]SDT59402.1 transcriptional regulator [Streptomyces sp. 2114.2]
MDLLSLRYFQSVARHQHISRAAEELRVAQPSVSRTIIRLESELGTPLFDRRGRRIRLNEHGAAFLVRVERALAELEDARREVADAGRGGPGRVAVAAETLLQLAGVLSAFRELRPGVGVRLFQAPVDSMRRHLRSGEVDFALASQPLTGPEVCSAELAREEVLLAVPVGHRLAGRERVAVAELADEDFVSTRPGHWQRALLERLFAREGLAPRVVCEGDEAAATPELVGAGVGIGLMPAVARRVLGEDGPVGWLRLDAPDCHRTLTLVWRRDAYLSPAALDFRRLAGERLMPDAS